MQLAVLAGLSRAKISSLAMAARSASSRRHPEAVSTSVYKILPLCAAEMMCHTVIGDRFLIDVLLYYQLSYHLSERDRTSHIRAR